MNWEILVIFSYQIFSYKDDKLNGECKTYYDNGQLKEIYSYNDGLMNGMYKSYYENGQLHKICSYIDGYANEKYNENGELIEN
jgi:antitoxin component YwqK of YwqJK toxin-antitoxin module